jgi:chromosome segregation and condensation protein ScpB
MPPLDPPLEPTDPADPHALPGDPVDAEFSEDEIELAYQRALAAFSDHETPDEFVPEESDSEDSGSEESDSEDSDSEESDGEDSDSEESDSEESALDPSESSEPDPSEPGVWAHTAADAESREEPALADAFAADDFTSDDFAADDFAADDFTSDDFAADDFASAAEVPDEDAASESYPEDSAPDNGFDADAAEDAAVEQDVIEQDVVDQDWIAEDPGAEEACAAAPEATTAEDDAAFAQAEDDVGDSDRENGADATWAEAGKDVGTAAEAEAEADAEIDAGDEPSLTADNAVDFALAADVSPGEPTLDAHVDPEAAHLSIEDALSDSEAAHVEDHSFAEAIPEAPHAESFDDTLDDSLDVLNGDAQPVPPELALGSDEPEGDEGESSGEVAEFADELPELALPDLSRLEAELAAAGVELADPEPPPEALASAQADLADESPAPHLAAPLTEAGARDSEPAVAVELGPGDPTAVLPVAGEPAGTMGLDAAAVAAASAAMENPPQSREAPGRTARGRRASSAAPAAPASEPQVTWRGDAAHGDRSSSLRGPRGVASDRFSPPPPTSAETITPAQVIEGALFVGGGPLSAGKLYALLRGTIALEDVPELIDDLNDLYASQNRPYEIRLGDGGYVLDLCPDYEKLRHRVFGQGPREVRLTQDQLEVLALVAYRQPISEAGIAALGRPEAGNVLRQLLRRELVSLERGEQGPKDVTYHTTERFLSVFGLASLAELPQPEDLAAR